MRFNPYYNKKLVLRCLGMFALMVVAMKVTKGGGFAVIIPFALMALTRNQPAMFLFYIMLSISAVILNGALAPKSVAFFMEQRAMMAIFGFLLATRVAGQRNSPIVKPFMLMMVYLLYMLIPSVMGWYPPVALMKIFLFSVIYLAFYGAANLAAMSSRAELRDVRSVLLAVVAPFILGSVLLIPFPGISMMNPELLIDQPNVSSLFQGMTNHSQCLGPVIACSGTLLFADLMFGLRRPDKFYLLLLVCCPLLVWKTSSRTAMGALLAGCFFALFFFSKARGISHGWRQKVMNGMFVVMMIGVIGMMLRGNQVKRFIVKRGYSEGDKISAEQVVSGRMAMSENQFANFKKSPLIGHGFQVSEEMKYRYTGPWYTTLSAPVEKGVWITAVLEEGGAVGMAIFLLFIFSAFGAMLKYRAYVGASVLFVCLVSNLGEFTLFSMSYAGGFVWAMVFAGVVLDGVRARDERRRQQMAFQRPVMM